MNLNMVEITFRLEAVNRFHSIMSYFPMSFVTCIHNYHYVSYVKKFFNTILSLKNVPQHMLRGVILDVTIEMNCIL